MIRPEAPPPTFWPAGLAGAEDDVRLDPALEELVKNDQWIDGFMKRLNYAIDDIVRRKPSDP